MQRLTRGVPMGSSPSLIVTTSTRVDRFISDPSLVTQNSLFPTTRTEPLSDQTNNQSTTGQRQALTSTATLQHGQAVDATYARSSDASPELCLLYFVSMTRVGEASGSSPPTSLSPDAARACCTRTQPHHTTREPRPPGAATAALRDVPCLPCAPRHATWECAVWRREPTS